MEDDSSTISLTYSDDSDYDEKQNITKNNYDNENIDNDENEFTDTDNDDNDNDDESEIDDENENISKNKEIYDDNNNIIINENEIDVNFINETDDDETDNDEENNDEIKGGDNSDKYNFNNDEEYEEEKEENYLQKFDNNLKKDYIMSFHQECNIHNFNEVKILSNIVRDENNNIIDDLHKTLPYLTKYEKARILGIRTTQLNSGAKPFIKVPENILNSYIIAEMELKQKKLPFIIRRPIGNSFEYWKVEDLEDILW